MILRVRIEPPGLPPHEREFDAGEISVGRAANADIVVADASVSRQHARLVRREDRWWLEVLSSRGTTFLNRTALSAPAPVGPGDVVRLGNTSLVILGGPLPEANTGTASVVLPAAAQDAARLRTINDVHRALATAISLGELLDLILERCFDVLRPEEGVILLRDVSGELRTVASRRQRGSGEVTISRRIIDEVAGKHRSALVLDAAMDERFAGSESIILTGVRSVLAAPLIDASGTLGLIALLSRVSVRKFTQDDLEMLESLASAAVLRVRNVALAEEAAARRVLEREMALAHDMQMSMLPRRLPDRPELDMAASLTSAQSVGGDLYDFVLHGDRLWFIVADVSGKGIAAALYTAVAKALFRATVHADADLGEVLGRLNRELCRDNEQMMFITALVGHLTLSTGEVVLGDAGHLPAVVTGPDGRRERAVPPKGPALGVLEEAIYGVLGFRLVPGATLLLYTDGATDARSPAGQLFGDAALERAIGAAAGRTAADLVAGVARAVDGFAAGAPPEDDLTLLAIRYRGVGTTTG